MRQHERPGEDAGLPELFWAVARRLRHSSQENLAQWDISPSQSRVILVLGRHERIRLSELSEHLRIAPRSTTEVVDALQEKGLVERQADPTDRRATLVTLTEAGRGILTQLQQARHSNSVALFEPLSDTDRDRLATILRKLI